MKIHIEVGKIRWWLVGVIAVSFITGASFGSLIVYASPTMIVCKTAEFNPS